VALKIEIIPVTPFQQNCSLIWDTGTMRGALVDAGGEIELHECVHRLRGGIDDVEHPLVRTHLELLAALLVDVRRTVDGEALDAGRQRDRTPNLRACTLRRVHDFTRRCIENSMIERFQSDADILAVHCLEPAK